MILDIESKLNLEEPTNEKELGTTYLTTFRELTPSEAASISIILANRAFSHSLTLEDMTNPMLATNPFIYTLNTSSS